MKRRKVVLLLLMICLLTSVDDNVSEDYYEPGDGVISGLNLYEQL